MARSKKFYVYILQVKDGRFYIGYTDDIEKRMEQHKKGLGSKFVRSFGFKKLCYVEEVKNKSLALKREHMLKQLSRVGKQSLINA